MRQDSTQLLTLKTWSELYKRKIDSDRTPLHLDNISSRQVFLFLYHDVPDVLKWVVLTFWGNVSVIKLKMS